MLSSIKIKNKSRNNNNLLLLFTEPIKNEKKNNLRTFSTGINKNLTALNLKRRKKKPFIINKKEFYKKKLKTLLINIENNENKNVFKNKKLIFEKINQDKEKIPKIKSQEQFNYYLINDFKDNEPAKNEIKKSLKNKKIDEEFEIYKSFIQEKRYYHNVSLIREYQNKYHFKTENSHSLNIQNLNRLKVKRKSKKKLTYHKPIIFNSDIYQKYSKNKEKELHHNINDSNKTMISIKKDRKSVMFFRKPLSKDVKDFVRMISSSRDQSSTDKNNSNKKITEKRSSKKLINRNISIPNKSYTNKYPNRSISNNLNENEQIYAEQIKEYNNYIKKVYNLKSKNYIDKIKKIELEKNKIREINGDNEWSDTKKIKLVKLNEDRLLLEVKRKNAFIDSFGMAAKNINDNEDDVDEDNYRGIKNYHLNMGLGAAYLYSLKYKLEPRYILNNFKRKTIERYKGNKGIFFGPKAGEIERLKKMYKK